MSKQKYFCSPGNKTHGNNICFPDKILNTFVKHIIGIKSGSRSKNISRIQKYMKKKFNCNSQTCWKRSKLFDTKKHFLSKSLWKKGDLDISNWELTDVLSQYSNVNDEFLYLGDIEAFKSGANSKYELLLMSLLRKSNNIKYRGIVVSLWEELRYLKHWVCIFLNNANREIIFFDSNGDRETRFLILPVIEIIIKYSPQYKVYSYNRVTVQYDKTSCGIFCIHFLDNLILGGEYWKFLKTLLERLDLLGVTKYNKYIHNLRDKYFILTTKQ